MNITKIMLFMLCSTVFFNIIAVDNDELQIAYNEKLNAIAYALNNNQLPKCVTCGTDLENLSKKPPQNYGKESSGLVAVECFLCDKNNGRLFTCECVYLHESCIQSLKSILCKDCRTKKKQQQDAITKKRLEDREAEDCNRLILGLLCCPCMLASGNSLS